MPDSSQTSASLATRPWMATACIAFTIVTWGTAFTGIAMGLGSFGPGALALLRFASATLTLWLVLRPPPIAREDWPRLIAISFVGITAYHVLLNTGQQVVQPATAALIIQTAPGFTALLSVTLGIERLSRWGWAGLAVAACGAALIVASNSAPEFSISALMILAAALATATYFVTQRPLAKRYGPLAVTTWSITIGTIPMLVFLPSLLADAPTATAESWIAAIFIGIVPGALAYATWNWAIAARGPARTVSWLYLVPIVAATTHWLWNGAVPTALVWVGGALAIAGAALVHRRGFITVGSDADAAIEPKNV